MMILEIFVMFDTAKVEIKKEHQLLMVGETTQMIIHENSKYLMDAVSVTILSN